MSEVAGRMAVQAAAHAAGVPRRRRRHPARRRPRHPGGQGHHHRRRRLRHRGGQDRHRHAGHRPGPRHQPGPAGLSVRRVRRPAGPGHPQPRPSTAAYVAESDVVIGAVLVPGAKAPKLVTREMIATHAAGQRRGRHRHRPGRLLRDQPADHPLRSDLRRGGRRALLRGQHPRRGRPHLHLGADQRHPAVPAQGRRSGRAGGGGRPTRRWRSGCPPSPASWSTRRSPRRTGWRTGIRPGCSPAADGRGLAPAAGAGTEVPPRARADHGPGSGDGPPLSGVAITGLRAARAPIGAHVR